VSIRVQVHLAVEGSAASLGAVEAFLADLRGLGVQYEVAELREAWTCPTCGQPIAQDGRPPKA